MLYLHPHPVNSTFTTWHLFEVFHHDNSLSVRVISWKDREEGGIMFSLNSILWFFRQTKELKLFLFFQLWSIRISSQLLISIRAGCSYFFAR